MENKTGKNVRSKGMSFEGGNYIDTFTEKAKLMRTPEYGQNVSHVDICMKNILG